VHLGTSGGKRLGGRIRTSEAEHLMARTDELLYDGRADEARGAGNKDSHVLILLFQGFPVGTGYATLCLLHREV
jgi:hypothetical protein